MGVVVLDSNVVIEAEPDRLDLAGLPNESRWRIAIRRSRSHWFERGAAWLRRLHLHGDPTTPQSRWRPETNLTE